MKLEEAIEHLETANFNYIGQLNEALEKVLEIARKNLPPMTDSEYAAHRRRKIELKRQRSQLQGGDNA